MMSVMVPLASRLRTGCNKTDRKLPQFRSSSDTLPALRFLPCHLPFEPSSGSCVIAAQILALALCCGSDHEANNEAVQAQCLSENEDQDHAYKQARLLRVCPNACITHDANGEAGGQRTHADSQTSSKMGIPRIGGICPGVQLPIDDPH